jgi:hypothetical protein
MYKVMGGLVWASLAAWAIGSPLVPPALAASLEEELAERIETVAPVHPRLFFTEAEEAEIRARLESEPLLQAVFTYIRGSADALLDQPPVERVQIGRRLLSVSRTCLQRVGYLAFTYRMTRHEPYLRRAEEEMLAAASFEDWNPSHFLDVAEMAAALAIGYDWLYNDLSPDTRSAVKAALLDKGLRPSMAVTGGWVSRDNNWNQVCHGGSVLGALAVLEDEPELALQITARAIANVPRAMHEYEPDGVYPEGPSYWEYGTSFNVLLIAALESVFAHDFGLGAAPGFLKTPEFYLHATGPSGLYFNFSDCGERGGISPAMHWLARRRQDPSLLWQERRALEKFATTQPDARGRGNRMLPFLLIWALPMSAEAVPAQLHWFGDGSNPVALFRSAWDDNATYVGVKGGSPSANHGHMDAGSFVLEMDGVRWGIDLGADGYHGLESKGVDLWNRRQDSQRWTVFRLNNFSHNTLVVDGELQQVKGLAPITAFSDEPSAPYALIDLTTLYEDQLAGARRGIRLAGPSVLVQDEVRALDRTSIVRWGMVTRAEVTLVDDTTAQLKQDGRSLLLRVLAPNNTRLRLFETENPPRDYDSRNPNTRMVGFESEIDAGAQATLAVFFQSNETPGEAPALIPLDEW